MLVNHFFSKIDVIGDSFDSIIDFFRFFGYCQNISSRHPNVTFPKVNSTLTQKRSASTASDMHMINNANNATLSNRADKCITYSRAVVRCKKSNMFTVCGCREDLFAFTILPASLNSLSEGTLVAGTQRNCLANLAKWE